MIVTEAGIGMCALVTAMCAVLFCMVDICFPIARGYRVVKSVPV